jgi:hypothetical protein
MVTRLGFAVATAVEPDIPLVDEILAGGDLEFQRNCMAWIDMIVAARARAAALQERAVERRLTGDSSGRGSRGSRAVRLARCLPPAPIRGVLMGPARATRR